MSDTLANAKTLLEADATLLALATGGVWDWDETGRMGINRTNTSTAFTDGKIKPCILLKLGSSVPFGDIADDENKIVGARDRLEVWAYQDNGYNTINAMLARVYTLLQGKPLGGFVCRWAGDTSPLRDTDMDANVTRRDFAVVYLQQ